MGGKHLIEGGENLNEGARHFNEGVRHLNKGVRHLNEGWKRQLILGGTNVNATSLIVRKGFIVIF